MHTPVIDFCDYKTSKQRAAEKRQNSSALDAAFAAIQKAGDRVGEELAARLKHLTSLTGQTEAEVVEYMSPGRIAFLLTRYPMTYDEMLADDVVEDLRRKHRGLRAARMAGHWTKDLNTEAAARRAYLAVRWCRFLRRRAQAQAAIAAE